MDLGESRDHDTSTELLEKLTVCDWTRLAPLPPAIGNRGTKDRRRALLLLAVWPLLVLNARAEPAATPHAYHVDAAHGDDRHDGLRPDSAWRTLERVNRAEVLPGDRVLFCRGETWRGQLVPHSGRLGAPVVYGAYGEGFKPRFLGSVARNRPEDWLETAPGVWATAPIHFEPIAVQAELGDRHIWLHHEAKADCSLRREPGSPVLRVECRQPGTEVHHIQLSFSGLTVQEGQDYVATFRARCSRPFIPAQAVIMKETSPWTSYAGAGAALSLIGENWADHAIPFHATSTARDARLTFFLGGVLPAGATLLIEPKTLATARSNQSMPLSVDVGNLIFEEGRAIGVKRWSETKLRYPGDFLYDARTWQVKLRMEANPATRYRGVELALKRHVIDQSGRSDVTYESLDLRYGAAHGIGGSGVQRITVRDCDISYIGGGHQMTDPAGHPVRYGNGIEFWSDARDCLVEGCRLWEIYDAALTNQGDGTNVQENIIYRRNQVWNCEYSFEFWNRGPKSRTRHIHFEHNTCVNAGYGWGHTQRPDPNGRHLMFFDNSSATEDVVIRSNVFSKAADSLMRLHGRDWTASLTMDFNVWNQPEGPLLLWGDQSVSGEHFDRFLHPRGLDRHSVVADPQFLNTAHQNFRLAPRSPARSVAGDGLPPGALP